MKIRLQILSVLLLAGMATFSANAFPENFDFSDPVFDPAEALDPGSDPDAEWARLLREGDRAAAAVAFVRLLREGESRVERSQTVAALRRKWFDEDMGRYAGETADVRADDVLELRYVGVYGITHQFEDGIDWHYDASEGKSAEWTWQFNRHYHWLKLVDAYEETGDAKYAEAWERELKSWAEQCPRPDDRGKSRGSAWRTIETGIRSGITWPVAFEVFRKSPHVDDEAFWRMFCLWREHALHLMKYPAGANWLIIETNGLAHAALLFPEMRGAEEFASTAFERASNELEGQFYPDGVHMERAPAYAAKVCVVNLYLIAQLADKHGRKVSPDYREKLARTVLALARTAAPNGETPALHDSPRVSMPSIYESIAREFYPERYPEAPWSAEGLDLLPYGGYAMFRRDGRYALLDAGPRGWGHYHQDELQFMTFAHGRWFTVDPGKPLYMRDPVAGHLKSSAAHNGVLMDGRKSRPAKIIKTPEEPMPIATGERDGVMISAARRGLLQVEGEKAHYDHERVVLDVDGFGWLVFDRLFPSGDGAHEWEWLWHFMADDVKVRPQGGLAAHENGPSMRVMAAGNVEGEWRVSRGEKNPYRGWTTLYDNSKHEPLPVLRFLSEGREGSVWLATLKAPFAADDDEESLSLEAVERQSGEWVATIRRGDSTCTITFSGNDEEIDRVVVMKNGGEPVTFSLGAHRL